VQIKCSQVVLMAVIDEDVFDNESKLEICKALKTKRMTFSGTVKSYGSNTKHEKLKIVKIKNDESLDLIAIGSNNTLTLKDISIENLVSVSIVINHPIDKSDIDQVNLNSILGISI